MVVLGLRTLLIGVTGVLLFGVHSVVADFLLLILARQLVMRCLMFYVKA